MEYWSNGQPVTGGFVKIGFVGRVINVPSPASGGLGRGLEGLSQGRNELKELV
jgi:hypothetical protein